MLGKIYGDGLSVMRGKIHLYLGVDFDYSTKGTVKLSMILYSEQIEDNFPKPITSAALSTAASHLFQVQPDGE